MITRFSVLLFLSFISSLSICQVRVTDVMKNENSNRVIVKEIDSKQIIIKISPNDYIRVFELNDGILTKKDEKYYPDLFNDVNYYISGHFFLTSNENGSIAYDLRDYTEFLIPYDDDNFRTQWSIKHNDFVKLLQSGSDYIQMHIDLITKEITPATQSVDILDLNDNFSRIRRQFENDDDELHVITNLLTQDSIVLNTGSLSYSHSAFNDHFFIYKQGNQIIKLNNIDFSSSIMTEIPADHTLRNTYLIDKYSVIVTRGQSFEYQLTIYDENNELIIDKELDFEIDRVYSKAIDNHILFAGKTNRLTTLNLETGFMKEEAPTFSYLPHELNESYLITYFDNRIYLISKTDLSITNKYYDKLQGAISNITSMGDNEDYYVSFDTRNEGDNTLFTVTNMIIESSPLLDDENSGISSSSDFWTSPTSDKLVLIEDNLFSFDDLGYDQINGNPISGLYLSNGLKRDAKQACWPELNDDFRFEIKCFKNDEVIDYGTLNLTSSTSFSVTLYNFIVHDNDILYFQKEAGSNKELRIKKYNSGTDSLIRNFSYSNSFIEVNNQPFFEISDTLNTYDFAEGRLHNLGIPLPNQFNFLDFTVHKEKVYVKTDDAVYELNGLDKKLIYQGIPNDYLGRLSDFDDYLAINTSTGYTFYDGTNLQEIVLENTEKIEYLAGKYLEIINTDYLDMQPSQIYNLETQETFQLPNEFLGRNIEFIISTDEKTILVSQNHIDGLNYYSLDTFDEEFSNYSNFILAPNVTNIFDGNKLVKSENHSIAILDKTILFIDNISGEIKDQITVFGIDKYYNITYKNGVLYFIKYDTDLGRQVFKYKSTSLNNVEYSAPTFTIYPNPSDHMLSIRAPQPFQQWNIRSASGKIISSSAASGSQVDIDVSDLVAGLYIIEVVSGDSRSVQNFIKM